MLSNNRCNTQHTQSYTYHTYLYLTLGDTVPKPNSSTVIRRPLTSEVTGLTFPCRLLIAGALKCRSVASDLNPKMEFISYYRKNTICVYYMCIL